MRVAVPAVPVPRVALMVLPADIPAHEHRRAIVCTEKRQRRERARERGRGRGERKKAVWVVGGLRCSRCGRRLGDAPSESVDSPPRAAAMRGGPPGTRPNGASGVGPRTDE